MKRLSFIFVLLAAVGCRTTHITKETFQKPPAYTIIYIIHGDSDYLYHTTTGAPRLADRHVLGEAMHTARKAKHGEVFIFYQKPETKILWLFPRKDRQLFYFRNGQLIHKQHYSPHSKTKSFVTEAKLYQKYSQNSNFATTPSVFLYMGHEIPVNLNDPYNLSRPNARFDTHTFVQGIQSFLQDSSSFDLTVISTCNNGTPKMVQSLSPFTHYILASPKDLHLSQINTGQLSSLLETGYGARQVADSMANHTFRRLKKFLETDVTLSIYNTQQTKKYLPPLAQQYETHLQSLTHTELQEENMDCANLPLFHVPDKANDGVKVWYQPSPFGRKTTPDSSFSGWGCKI